MMTNKYSISQRVSRAGLALVAGAVLLTGAAWHSVDAQSQSQNRTAATVTAPITHAIAGGRDSYADVVSAAAPAGGYHSTQSPARGAPAEVRGQGSGGF